MEKSHLNFVKQSNATYSSSKKWYLDRLLCAIISKVSRLVWQVNNLSSKQAKITPVQRLIYNNLLLKFTQNDIYLLFQTYCVQKCHLISILHSNFNQYSSSKRGTLYCVSTSLLWVTRGLKTVFWGLFNKKMFSKLNKNSSTQLSMYAEQRDKVWAWLLKNQMNDSLFSRACVHRIFSNKWPGHFVKI